MRGQSPANVVAMESVPPVLRPLAIAFSTIAVHVLGDVPSPPILGALQVQPPWKDPTASLLQAPQGSEALIHLPAGTRLDPPRSKLPIDSTTIRRESGPLLHACLQDATQSFRITMPVFIVVYLPAAAVWYSGALTGVCGPVPQGALRPVHGIQIQSVLTYHCATV